MPRELPVPITPNVLKWAMAESGYDATSLGNQLGVEADLVQRWLDGIEQPGLGQFRQIARALRRPTATFLLPSPPTERPPPVAFRHPPGEIDRDIRPDERHRVREVARLQRVVGWVTDQLEDTPPPLPRLDTSLGAEIVAEHLRSLLDIPLKAQFEWKDESEAIRSWRRALERTGTLVFFLPMGPDAARGFSLFDERAPAIAVNTHWNQAARIFTLIHELAHLVTRTNSICTEVGSPSELTKAPDDLERWCEQTAAATLMPASAVSTVLTTLGTPVANLVAAGKIARQFKVSLRAAALRLVTLGHANWGLYARIPGATDSKTGGGGASGGRKRAKIRVDEYGRRTTSLILRALHHEVITPADAMGYLDVSYSNLEELADLV